MERTIAVFRALDDAAGSEPYHRNHAQIGYALKDKEPPDLQGAEKALDRAISMRAEANETGWHSYEFNRAVCRVGLDEQFQNEEPSQENQRGRILADLSYAAKDPLVLEWMKEDKLINKWLSVNSLDLGQLCKPAPHPSPPPQHSNP